MSQKIVQKRRLQTLEKHLEIDADLEVPDADQEVQDADQGKDFLEPFVLFLLTLGKDYYIDGQNTELIFFISTGGGKKAPQITPRGWIFWTIIFYWAAQTQPFFDTLPEITDFCLLQQS